MYQKKMLSDYSCVQLCLKQSASKYNFVLLFCTKNSSSCICSYAVMDCLTLNCIFVFIFPWKGYNCKRLANAWSGCGGLTLASHRNRSIICPSSTGEGKKCNGFASWLILHQDKTGRSLSSYSHAVKTDVVLGDYLNLPPIKSAIMRIRNKS